MPTQQRVRFLTQRRKALRNEVPFVCYMAAGINPPSRHLVEALSLRVVGLSVAAYVENPVLNILDRR